jgi:chemotaxis protein methyltransferase CheR
MELTKREFEDIAQIMYKESGVHLKSSKMSLILNRLNERLISLGFQNYSQYITLLKNRNKSELEQFINQLTTNETFFFRHTIQFNYLVETAFSELMELRKTDKKIRIWSAACSTGEEPYSLAILCKNYFSNWPSWRVEILASDINTEVLHEAQNGIYDQRSMREVPSHLVSKYFRPVVIEKTPGSALHSVIPEVKKMVNFCSHNLKSKLLNRGSFDIVFLRNVLIYFDDESKKNVLENIVSCMTEGSYIFVGLSESLNEFNSLKFVDSGIYKKVTT